MLLCSLLQFLYDVIVIPVSVWLAYLAWRKPGKPNVIFADHIIRESAGEGKYIYKIRFMNIGYRSLHECTRMIKLNIETMDTPGGLKRIIAAYLKVGDADVIPVIEGTNAFGEKYRYSTPDITIGDMSTFKRADRFDEQIRLKAEEGKLTFYDVIERYKNEMKIEVYVFGEDGRDGRLTFKKTYTSADIKDGEFDVIRDKFSWSWCMKFIKSKDAIEKAHKLLSKKKGDDEDKQK